MNDTFMFWIDRCVGCDRLWKREGRKRKSQNEKRNKALITIMQGTKKSSFPIQHPSFFHLRYVMTVSYGVRYTAMCNGLMRSFLPRRPRSAWWWWWWNKLRLWFYAASCCTRLIHSVNVQLAAVFTLIKHATYSYRMWYPRWVMMSFLTDKGTIVVILVSQQPTLLVSHSALLLLLMLLLLMPIHGYHIMHKIRLL